MHSSGRQKLYITGIHVQCILASNPGRLIFNRPEFEANVHVTVHLGFIILTITTILLVAHVPRPSAKINLVLFFCFEY